MPGLPTVSLSSRQTTKRPIDVDLQLASILRQLQSSAKMGTQNQSLAPQTLKI